MKNIRTIAILAIFFAITVLFAQTPFQNSYIERKSPQQVIAWEEAIIGSGDIVLLTAKYNSSYELIESRIVPLVLEGDYLRPLDEITFGTTNVTERKIWRGFSEYGSEGITPFAERPPSEEDFAASISTIDACPNLNIKTEDGILSVNLAYIDGISTKLIAHTKITVRQVFQGETRSLLTGELLDDFYRADFGGLLLSSHIGMESEGKLIVALEPQVWAKAAYGLYVQNNGSGRRWVAFNRNLTQSAAVEEAYFGNSTWHALIYASPRAGISATIADMKGLDFGIDNSIWFGDAAFDEGLPSPSREPYVFKIEASSEKFDLSNYHFPRTKLRTFEDKPLSPAAKAILGLNLSKDDTDGDGISDYLEILMFSDPTDAFTENEHHNDFELYFKMGMYPPLTTRREFPDEMKAPPPKIYPDDHNPSSTIRPITTKRGAPIQLKFESLMYEGRIAEAKEVRDRFELMFIFVQYGEEAMINYHNRRDMFSIMRRTEEWDTSLYGSIDSDRDGIPDGLEQSGRLFGGENYPHYGIHYWEEDLRLRMAYILGTEIDGLYIRDFINDSLWDMLGIVFISTEWQFDTSMGIDGYDTDKDGLDDYAEYLWCSCPLLKKSDPTPGAPNDFEKVQHHFIPPRMDWIAWFQDWDQDSIPNGAELYYIPELGYGILDPYCKSSDWDQYSDRLEWMSWQFKNCPTCPYPLDDPLPLVIRNGCHPLIPAYPEPSIDNFNNYITIPFGTVIKSSRGMSGEATTEAKISTEAGVSAGNVWAGNPMQNKGPFIKIFTGTKVEGSTEWKVSNEWEWSAEEEFDYADTYVWNWLRLKNCGTEPFDRNVWGDDYHQMHFDVFWPGNPTKVFAPNELVTGMDGLVPYTGGSLGLPDSIDFLLKHQLREMIGLGGDIDLPELDSLSKAYSTFDKLRFGQCAMLVAAIPTYGIGAIGFMISLGVEYKVGLSSAEAYEDVDDIYGSFVNAELSSESMIIQRRAADFYNMGDGTFSCTNLCDWTSIQAAHRSYVTIMCVYPEASAYVNMVRESPIKDTPTALDSFYTLAEFIDKYSSGSGGPPKIEKFTWSSDDAETLIQVGCLPNVALNGTWIPPSGSSCDTIKYAAQWVVISSIDTVTEPSRKDDLCMIRDSLRLCGNTKLKPGDIIIFNYIRDSDNDSLEDNMEMIFGTNPYNPDTDGDGLFDGYEIKLGLDPLNPNSDNSLYEASDGAEMAWLLTTDTLRLPVETFEGDTIYPPRISWDSTLAHSPRITSGYRDFVPWNYNDGAYNSKNDDQYMDANLNGLADWVEHYFRDPNSYWNGRFRITWDGEQTRTNPFGYSNKVKESRFVRRDSTITHLTDTTTLYGGNRVLEIACWDMTGEGAGVWDHAYAYFKLFNCNIEVNKYLEISYDLWPRTTNGKKICVDLLFSDHSRAITDSTFRDVYGFRMHPAWRPSAVSIDTFHRVTASLEPFDGKTIIGIMVGYEDNPNDMHGLVHAYFDNLTITNKNIVFEFEPDQAPAEGFNINAMVGEAVGFRAWNGEDGTPLCSLAMLSSLDPRDTTDIPIDTMRYGPRGMVYEVNAHASPMSVDSSQFGEYHFMFSLLPEKLEYSIETQTILGYYIWHDHAPALYHERYDIPDLIPPKVVIDFQIYNPISRETVYMLDYLWERGEEIKDQWGNSIYPWERNEIDSEEDLTYRPVSGNFWRYIDIELPDILEGWRIDDVLIRYTSDLPLMGNLRSYIDNVAIFQRSPKVYADTFGVYIHFGDRLADDVDNNVDTIVDWEEIHIHKIPESHLTDDYASITYASLLLSNDIGPWSFTVDTVSGDTSWHWFEIDRATGDTSYSWFAEFAMNPDSSFKLAQKWLVFEDSLTTLIDVDSFPTTDFNDDDSMRNFGFLSNVPGDFNNIYNPHILCQRVFDGEDEGILLIESHVHGFLFDYMDSTKLFDVRQLNPCSLCTKRCLFMVFEAWVDYGAIQLGYKLEGADEIIWFDEITSPAPTEYRCAVPDTFVESDSSDIVESVWIKTLLGTRAYLDNFMLRRAFYASFEPNDPPTFLPDRLMMHENVIPDTCDIFTPEIAWPTPTDRDHYLYIHGNVNGFSPARFKYDIWELPPFEELELTDQSKLSFNIFYFLDFPTTFGNAIIDLRLISFDDTDTSWLSEYFLRDSQGQLYHPQMRVDQLNTWVSVEVPLGGLPPMRKVDRITVYFNKPSVVSPGDYHIFIDEILITL